MRSEERSNEVTVNGCSEGRRGLNVFMAALFLQSLIPSLGIIKLRILFCTLLVRQAKNTCFRSGDVDGNWE